MTQSRPWMALTALMLALAGGLAVAGNPDPPCGPRCPYSGAPPCQASAPCATQTASAPELLPYPEEEQERCAGDGPACPDPVADAPCCHGKKAAVGTGGCRGTPCHATICPMTAEGNCPTLGCPKTACPKECAEECCPTTCRQAQPTSCEGKTTCPDCPCADCCKNGGQGCCQEKDGACPALKRAGGKRGSVKGGAWIPVPPPVPPGVPVPQFVVVMPAPIDAPPAVPCPWMGMPVMPPGAVPPPARPAGTFTVATGEPAGTVPVSIPAPAVYGPGLPFTPPQPVALVTPTAPAAPAVNVWRIDCIEDEGKTLLQVAMTQAGETTTLRAAEMTLTVGGEELKVAAAGEHVQVAGSFFKAKAATISRTGQDGLALEGDVQVKYERDGHKACVSGERVTVGLADGRLEVNPASARAASLR